MKQLLTTLLKFIFRVLAAIVIDVALVFLVGYIYVYEYSSYGRTLKAYAIYAELLTTTGQTEHSLPLRVVDSPSINAYNDGQEIVLYTGLINETESWDEVALVLGHEIAHGTLGHLNEHPPVPDQLPDSGMGPNDYISILEANADKLGAVYMMKAGYDVCKGREIMLRWEKQNGNALGESHPDYAYRYSELNINCQ